MQIHHVRYAKQLQKCAYMTFVIQHNYKYAHTLLFYSKQLHILHAWATLFKTITFIYIHGFRCSKQLHKFIVCYTVFKTITSIHIHDGRYSKQLQICTCIACVIQNNYKYGRTWRILFKRALFKQNNYKYINAWAWSCVCLETITNI